MAYRLSLQKPALIERASSFLGLQLIAVSASGDRPNPSSPHERQAPWHAIPAHFVRKVQDYADNDHGHRSIWNCATWNRAIWNRASGVLRKLLKLMLCRHLRMVMPNWGISPVEQQRERCCRVRFGRRLRRRQAALVGGQWPRIGCDQPPTRPAVTTAESPGSSDDSHAATEPARRPNSSASAPSPLARNSSVLRQTRPNLRCS